MPLVNTTEMFKKAYEGGYAIGAFNVDNVDIMKAVLRAAENKKAPVIIAVSSGALKFIGENYIRQVIDSAMKEITVPVALHLDHGSYEGALKVIEAGFSSVMFDGSHYPIEENIAKTKAYVQRKGNELLIEGACDEIVDATGEARCEITDADKCAHYMAETGVDVVVANLGTEHRASGQDLHYYSDAAKAIKAKIVEKDSVEILISDSSLCFSNT